MTGNTISLWVADLGIWPLVVVLVPNLLFRRYGQAAGKKRMASLFQAIAIFVVTTVAAFIAEKELTDSYLFIAIVAIAVVLYIFRAKVFPYRFKCAECDDRLDSKSIYFMDDNLCPKCHSARLEREEAEAAGEELESTGETDVSEEIPVEDSWPGSGADDSEKSDSED